MARHGEEERRHVLALAGTLPLALFGCARESVAPAAGTSAAQHHKRLAAQAFQRWRDGSGGPFELLAPDATWTIVGSSQVAGRYGSRQQFFDVVINPFNARLSRPLVPSVRALYADGDTVVVFFDGEAMARDGKPYRNTYTWYLRFRGDQVVDVVAFFDPVAFDELWSRVAP
jgi:ketosteroid isomerase-like protein